MGIRRWKTLFDSNVNTSGTGAWIALDVRYEEHALRSIMGAVITGDTVTVQGITKDIKGIDKSFLTTLETQDITNLNAYTADFNDVLIGPWTYVRVVKTGTAGRAKVEGFI